MTNARISVNSINNLWIRELGVVDEEDLKRHVEEFFRSLYYDERPIWPQVDGLNLPLLGAGQLDWLGRPFDEEEVKKAMWSLNGDKAPEPDGFTIAFYKACWEVILGDLILVIYDFFERGFLDKGSNTTYISLIPKKEGAERITDFRPISLVGSMYKIISKCLALQLIEVLSGIVSKEQ